MPQAPITFATLADLAALSSAAYDESTSPPPLPNHWSYLTHANLGNFNVPLFTLLPPGLRGFSSNNIFFNFVATVPISSPPYFYPVNASGFAAVNDDTHQIAILFRGTETDDPLSFVSDFIVDLAIIKRSIDHILSGMDVFIDAVMRYANQHPSYSLLSAGHSLGGAIAEQLAGTTGQIHNIDAGLSFGGPGFTILPPFGFSQNPNFVHIYHSNDPIGHFALPLGHIGSEVEFNDNTLSAINFASHGRFGYIDEINFLNGSDAFHSFVPPDGFKIQFFERDTGTGYIGFTSSSYAGFFGTAYGDAINGSDRQDALRIDGWSGADTINGGWNQDVLAGGDGNDIIHGNYGNDALYGGNDNDTLYGDQGSDSLSGGDGNDTLYGGSQIDYLEGGNGDDSLIGGSSGDYYSIGLGQGHDVIADAGGAGQPDLLRFYGGSLLTSTTLFTASQAAGLHLDVAANGLDLLVRGYSTAGTLILDVTIQNMGVAGNQIERLELYAGAGDAYVGQVDLFSWWETHTGGNATPPVEPPVTPPGISHDSSNDSYSGTPLNDGFLSAGGQDYVDGGAGYDTLTVDYRWSPEALTAYFNGGGYRFYDASQTNTVQANGIENIILYATSGNDSIQLYNAGTTNDTVDAGAGDDYVYTGDGNDTIFGGTENDTLIGGAGDDYLIGGEGSDQLYGGTGSNTLQGGSGDDVYFLENAGDSIVEFAGEGFDEIRTSLAVVTLANNVERLTYTGGATSTLLIGGVSDNAITGGTGRDELFGREGNDTLSDGGGVAGNEDTMLGGTGDDVYIVTVRGDSTIEYAGEGTDEVRTTFSVYGLQANIENLTFTDDATHGAGVGNILDNVLTGGTGADDLFGREGNDTLIGGTGSANTLLGQEGDDLYIIAAAGDSVIEFTGQGIDIVQTALSSFVLRENVENLIYAGLGSFIGIGSSDANSITGGAGADFLSGLDGNDVLIGGSDADTLLGGNGADQFRYNGGETGLDRILDFESGSDRIALSATTFAHSATLAFAQGGAPVATTANSTFLYDSNTGILSYDADGTGAGAAVQIAQLNAGLTLSVGDFAFF
jgi:Ca2+-binding RTX toxin-like protein